MKLSDIATWLKANTGKIAATLAALAITVGVVGAIRKETAPASTDTKESSKIVTDAKKVTKKTTTKVTKSPDGTTTTETSVTESTGTVEKTADSSKETVVITPKKNTVSALTGFDIRAISPVYGVMYQRQVLDNVSVGAFAITNATVGVMVGVSF